MLKIIGILLGSALAVAFLIFALGVPGFSASEVRQPTLIERSEEPGPAAAPAVIPEPEALPVEHPQAELAEPPAVVASPDPGPDTEALVEQLFDPAPEAPEEEHWYAFWSPFRSEIAAQGFVSKLQESTGIDYRVVKIRTGVYEVAFAYDDDADIEDKLARISSATGLSMTDS